MPPESELRKHRCSFTGHRPEKLLWPKETVIAGLEQAIKTSIADGFTTYLSGMARGTDIWAAEIVLRLRAEGRPIRLICASPFPGFESSWSGEWRERYQRIMAAADLVRFICPKYSRDCFQRRNEWMVDHSTRIISVYNGQRGGTWNTIRYAQAQGVGIYPAVQ